MDGRGRPEAGGREVGRAPEPLQKEEARFEAMQATDQVEARAFSEYHLHEIDHPVTLDNQQTKRIEFLASGTVPVGRTYVYEGASSRWIGGQQLDCDTGPGSEPTAVSVHRSFETSEEAGVGRSLPAGRVRMYREDLDGSRLLIGEDRIGHTPRDETVRLTVGRAFDLIEERTPVDYVQTGEQSLEGLPLARVWGSVPTPPERPDVCSPERSNSDARTGDSGRVGDPRTAPFGGARTSLL